MGLFSFIKSAGKALGIVSEDEAPSAEALKAELDSHNLGTDNITVEVDGDKAVIKGDAADQTTLEKAIIAVGNTLGISKVESTVSVPDEKEPTFHTA